VNKQGAARNLLLAVVPRRLWTRILAAVWSAICLVILVNTLRQLGTSARVYDAVEVQMYAMFLMSFPTGGWIYSAISHVTYNVWPYSEEDVRTILLLWTLLFVPGYIQWFVLPGVIARIHKRFQ